MRLPSVFAAVAGMLSLGAAFAAGPEGTVRLRFMELDGPVPERAAPLSWLTGEEAQTLRSLVERLERIGSQDGVDGLVIRLKDISLNAAAIEEIGQAMLAARGAGKKVHVYAESYGPAELRLASYADEVILQEGGVVMLPGVHVEEMYFAEALAWAGIKADFVQVGDYKGASEALARSAPSEQWDQNINGLLDSLYGQMCSQLMKGRGLTSKELEAALGVAWLAGGPEAKSHGLIDAEIDLPELSKHFEQAYGKTIAWSEVKDRNKSPMLDASANPFAMMSMLLKEPQNKPRRETIAVVHIDGPIVDGDSGSGGLFGGGGSVGSRSIRKALQEIEENDLVKGLVVRINSPGGSAVASESIWQGVRRVAAKKPVYVSVGSMAASGGYYIAVAGDRVYVNPSSIVGSIGVVGGKLALGGLMEKLNVHVVSRSRGPMASMMSSTSTWTEGEREFVRSRMAQTYELFTRRVEQGRDGIELAKTAEGRLFAGEAAVKLKMADEVGSMRDAVVDLAAAAKLREGTYDVMDFPGPKGLQEIISEMTGGMALSPAARGGRSETAAMFSGAARELLGEAGWATVRDSAELLLQMRTEPVMLTSPRVLIFR